MTRTTMDALQHLKAQRDKLDARIHDYEAREKTRQRKHDLQRKILIGAYILEQAHHEGSYDRLLQKLDAYLTRDNDRKLFDLLPLSQAQAVTTPITTDEPVIVTTVATANDDDTASDMNV